MPYAADLTHVMGIGSHVGEVREAPNGQLYEWVEGVDGLGNPIGFWRALKKAAQRVRRGLKSVTRFAMPFSKFIPGIGPAVYAAGTVAQRSGLLGTGHIAQGADGQLYEYVESVDGLGNPVGFWRQLRKAAGSLISRIPGVGRIKNIAQPFCQALPQLQSCIQSVPAAEPAYRMATRVCGGLRQAGLAGTGLMEAPDGQLYEVVEGIGAAGQRRRTLRRVRLIIPAYIGSGRRRRVAAPTTAAPTATAGRVAFYS